MLSRAQQLLWSVLGATISRTCLQYVYVACTRTAHAVHRMWLFALRLAGRLATALLDSLPTAC